MYFVRIALLSLTASFLFLSKIKCGAILTKVWWRNICQNFCADWKTELTGASLPASSLQLVKRKIGSVCRVNYLSLILLSTKVKCALIEAWVKRSINNSISPQGCSVPEKVIIQKYLYLKTHFLINIILISFTHPHPTLHLQSLSKHTQSSVLMKILYSLRFINSTFLCGTWERGRVLKLSLKLIGGPHEWTGGIFKNFIDKWMKKSKWQM